MIGICGSILATAGLFVSFYATSISFLVASIGVMSGIGISASYITSLMSVGEYFHGSSELLAVSFVTSGAGCGGIAFPYILDFLINSFEWTGSMLGVGVLMLLMVPFSAVCKPVSFGIYVNKTQKIHTDINQGKKSDTMERHLLVKTIKDLVKNKVYVIYVTGISCGLSDLNSVKIFVIDYLHTKGFDHESALLLFLSITIACAIGMVLPGLCNYIPRVHFFVIPAIFSGIGVMTNAFLPSASTFLQHAIVLGGHGLAQGAVITSVPTTTLKLVGIYNFPIGMGIVMTMIGISSVCGGFLSGFLRDMTKSYAASSYAVSIGAGVATVLYITAAVLSKSEGDSTDKYQKGRFGRRRSSIPKY